MDNKYKKLVDTLPKESEDLWFEYNLAVNKIIQENNQLKEQLKTKHEGFMASVEQNCEYATILIELRSWLEENIEHTEWTSLSEGYLIGLQEVLSKLNELEEDKNENNRI